MRSSLTLQNANVGLSVCLSVCSAMKFIMRCLFSEGQFNSNASGLNGEIDWTCRAVQQWWWWWWLCTHSFIHRFGVRVKDANTATER